MKNCLYLMLRAAAVFAAAFLFNGSTACPASAQTLPGSYLASCTNAHYDPAYRVLSAICRDRDGNSHTTVLEHYRCSPNVDTYNYNGHLGCLASLNRARGYAIPRGSYRASCADMNVVGAALEAYCSNGSESGYAQLDISKCDPLGDIANAHGTLVCKPK